MLSTSLKTDMAETTILTINSIAINSIKCLDTRDTKEKLRLTCGVSHGSSQTLIKCVSRLRCDRLIGQYRIHKLRAIKLYWCGGHTLSDSGVHTLGDTSTFVNPAGQLLLTRRVKGALYFQKWNFSEFDPSEFLGFLECQTVFNIRLWHVRCCLPSLCWMRNLWILCCFEIFINLDISIANRKHYIFKSYKRNIQKILVQCTEWFFLRNVQKTPCFYVE